jgi:rod shape-determining protein MreC
MNFHQKNNNFSNVHNKNKKYFWSIIVVIFLIFIFSLSYSRNILFSIGNPLWSVKNGITNFFASNFEVLRSKNGLLEENNYLKKQLSLKENDQVLFDLLKKENEDLKNILNRKKDDQKLILASVLVKPFLSLYDTLIIDIGILDGVKVGDRVLVDGNVFIGYVSEVYDTSAKVVLYSSPGEKIKVLVGNNNIEKEAVGLGGGNFKVEIPREIDVKEGDSIIIPSISPNIFGIIEKIEFKESDSFQSVLFKNPTNIAELRWVEVLSQGEKAKK